MHPAQALFKAIRTVSPSLGAQIRWRWSKSRADFATRVVDELVQPGQVVVDVGAHWGLFTARFAHLTGPSGEVHAIEPNPIHRRSLDRLRRRHLNVRLYEVAVSDTDGESALHVPIIGHRAVTASATLNPAGSQSIFTHNVITVRTRTLDSLFSEKDRAVAFIKCDVEGHEQSVITGAAALIKRSMPTLLVEIEQRHRDDEVQTTFAHLLSLGYESYALFPNGLRPLKEFDLERDQLSFLSRGRFVDRSLPASYVYDFLFVRKDADVGRLRANGPLAV